MTRNPNVTILTKEQYEVAKSNGINRQTACSRVRDLGWEVERAISEKPYSKSIFFTDEELAIIKKNKLKEKVAKDRITRYGWDRELAISKPVPYRILH